MTPFLCAVAAGHTDCAKMLLGSGAEIAARDKFQRCCIHLAVENDKEEVLKVLLEISGTGLTNVPDVHERTALHYAALSTNTRVRTKTRCKRSRQSLNCKCTIINLYYSTNSRECPYMLRKSLLSVIRT